MGSLGAPELILILLVVLLLFGGAKLPKLAKSLGQAQKEFKDGLHEGSSSDSDKPSEGPISS
jgi:sec-independent protein translocase protein TatA